jgi:alpha-D-ribose 1-methylphosphonate 5-triphosphate diphosphatase
MAHDAQMVAAGVTTVYDSLSCGTVFGAKDFRKEMFPEMVRAIEDGSAKKAFRIEHRIHVRCELSADDFPETLGNLHEHSLVQLISLMDHTPGQRQFKSREHLKTYNLGNGKTEAQHDRDVAVRLERGPENVARNWPYVVDLFRHKGIPIATHDDTTEDDIKLALESGAVIAEFPTTVEAAKAAKLHGLGTVAGAPNMVRGQSHFGGVSALDLAKQGLLDGLSSDYVPSSLLQAVVKLAEDHAAPLEQGYGMVSWKIADMLGLKDRGRMSPGARADIIQFRNVGHTPIVRSVWVQGQRAF